MCKANEYIKQLTEIYVNISKDYEETSLQVRKYNAQQQDLLHMVENETFNAARGYELAKTLKDVRVDRRDAKNELETLEKLKKGFVDDNIQQLIKVAEQIKNKDETLKRLKENKVYTPRLVDGELTMKAKQNILKVNNNKTEKQKRNEKLKAQYVENAITKNGQKICVLKELDDDMYITIFKNGKCYNTVPIKKCNVDFL